MLMLLGWG